MRLEDSATPQGSATKKPVPCLRCGFHYQCICEEVPQLGADIALVLLTHPNERHRDTNTGKLLTQTLAHCQQVIWQRKSSLKELLPQLTNADVMPYLLFPQANSALIDKQVLLQQKNGQPLKPLFIILDATWQEAHKMYRQTPWLNQLPTYKIALNQLSNYTLRRNQVAGNLCSCEVGQALLASIGFENDAARLDGYFRHYLAVFAADKCGHPLK